MQGFYRRILVLAVCAGWVGLSFFMGCSKKDESNPTGPAIADATIKGMVNNAINGSRLAGATVEADDGNTATSQANGSYELDLSSGARTLTITKTGFDTSRRNIQVSSGAVLENINIPISPVLTGSQTLRFVLSWGATPRDMDAHLLTPEISGSLHHIYYGNKGDSVAAPFATLDVDSTNGYGPETITVSALQPGTYHYWIQVYSTDAPLVGSGAAVEIYGRQGSLGRYTAPASGTYRYWHICDIDGASGAIQMVNQLASMPPGTDLSKYKVRLTWNQLPTDMDLHLLTPFINGAEYNISAINPGDSLSAPYATHGGDVRTGYGAETITIHQFSSGTYTFCVDNYSREVPLTESRAVVAVWDWNRIYLIGGAIVPTSGAGRYWLALEINGSSKTINVLNQLTDTSPWEPAPALSVTPDTLDFSSDNNDLSITIRNSGGGTLIWSVGESVDWLGVSPTNGQATTENDVVTVTIDRTDLSPGTYSGNISVTSNGGNTTVAAVMEVVAPPNVELAYDNGPPPDDFVHISDSDAPGWMAVRMSPSGPGKLISMKFYTSYSGSNRGFSASAFSWTGTAPDNNLAFPAIAATAVEGGWVEIFIPGEVTFTGTFVVGFWQPSQDVWLGYDNADNNRAWAGTTIIPWGEWDVSLFIRAVVQYSGGRIAELGPTIGSRQNSSGPLRIELGKQVKEARPGMVGSPPVAASHLSLQSGKSQVR